MSRNVIEIGAAIGIAAAYLGFAQLHRPVQEQPTRQIVQPYDRQVPYTTEQKAIIAALSKPTESETIPTADNRRNLIHYIDYMKELVINRGGKELQTILESDNFSYKVDIGLARHGIIKETEDKSAAQVSTYTFPFPDTIVKIITNNPPKPAERISWPFEVDTWYNKNGKTVKITFAAQPNSSGDGWRFIPRAFIQQDPTPPGGY